MALWDYPTNFSNGTNVDTLGSFVTYSNYVSGNWAMTAFVFIIAITVFSLSVSTGMGSALIAAGFTGAVFSMLLLRLELVSPLVPIISLFVLIGGVLLRRSDISGGRM